MNWSILFVFIIICIVLLIICYILQDKVEKQVKADKRCMNCRTKQYEDMMDIRCKNKKSEYYGNMMDDYAVCDCWKGARE
ncbi:MAG: hypothetical protein K0R34_3294 [Herbinix sp.]|nr:hypothetical protein [Herbinix sp.]